MVMPRVTPSAPERPTAALSPRMAQAVVLAQQGLKAREIAAALAAEDGSMPMDVRSVRRLLSDARKRGAVTTPPSASEPRSKPRQGKGGRFKPEPAIKPAKVR